MKKRIIVIIAVMLLVACSEENKEEEKAKIPTSIVCSLNDDNNSNKVTISFDEKGYVTKSKQVVTSSLTTFSDEEIDGLEKMIETGNMNYNLKQIDGLEISETINKEKLLVETKIDYEKVSLSDLYDNQLINEYDKDDNKLTVKEYAEYLESYYSMTCKEKYD
ncbi:hypothetical protein [Breznakia pachnodae]|uniref:Lipoprotein n=1 Tax=Breznakia pachnodae TaxID=265178 RepID=A0ABU0E3X4_9FIRM|nr:hypothetical protein [Breznakia pachnodae]MDQ0361593.1 hypothetical protein [Breznakia pachnodae]